MSRQYTYGYPLNEVSSSPSMFYHTAAMGAVFYRTLRAASRFVRWQTIRQTTLNAEQANRDSGFILACTHISHLEPIILSTVVRCQVHWMARVEFFQNRLAAAIMNASGAFPVDRFNSSLRGVRAAVQLCQDGRCVGIFPEGCVSQGQQSVLCGAPIKQGVCTVAIQAGVPIVPTVVLGTERLNNIRPWLPFRRGRVYCAFGNDILPSSLSGSRRMRRFEMSSRVEDEFQRLYWDLYSNIKTSDMDLTTPLCTPLMAQRR